MNFQLDALRISNYELQPVEKTWALVQYDDRPLDKMALEFVNRNKYYCKIHGYTYIFLNKGYEHLPPYWAKVKIAWDILQLEFSDHAEHVFKGVIWMDMDAVVYDLDRRLEDLGGDPDKSFIYAPDPIGLSSSFNAGVWMVRNTPAGRHVMSTWFGQFRPEAWRRAASRWSTTGEWAGENYEQGAFINRVAPRLAESLQALAWQTLQGISPATAGAFALHLFSCGHALGLGLIKADRHILEVLRAKHAQGDAAAVPPIQLLVMKINLGAALLEVANAADAAAAAALYAEGEAVLESALRLDPACGSCASNLASIRRNRLLRASPG